MEARYEMQVAMEISKDVIKKVNKEFEEAFGINIPDEAAEKISTVGDAIKYIEENVKAE